MTDSPIHELDVHAAVAALCEEFAPIAQRESVQLDTAIGRVLASDLVSPLDLPAFANAAVDGYAVRAADCKDTTHLRVTGTALAGHSWSRALDAGTAVRIMTGAPLPPAADAVIIQEETTREGDVVSFSAAVRAGQNVRARGEHLRAGDVVIAAGKTLRAAEIGLAAAVGVTQLPALRRLRVGLASTGDELADPPTPLAAAGSYDANRPMLALSCRDAGFTVVDLGICRDEAIAFATLIDRARAEALDALLISGGSALGDADVVRKAEATRFLAVNIRPGRGITFADFGQGSHRLALIGLPGNAVAAFIMFHLIALPGLRHLAGGVARVPEHLPLPLAVDLNCKPGRVDYRRGRFEYDPAGEVTVRPLEQQGSAMLRTIVAADVLIAAGPKPRYRAGERILVVPLAGLPH